MSKGLDLIKRQQPEIIDGFPTGNIYIGVTKEELTELEKELKEKEKYKAIEEELGIDLITLLKALKHGIYVKNRKNEIRRVSCNIGLVETGGCNSLGLRFQDTNYKWRYLVLDTSRDNDVKDYGKTWALTKEELKK